MMHYYATDKAHIFLDDVINAVVIRWHSFAQGDDFRIPLDKMIELAVAKKVKKALFDSSHTLVLAEDATWFAEEWLPRLRNAGIEYTATVNPKNPVTAGESTAKAGGKPKGVYQHHEFGDVHSAVGWLSGISA